jgi:uncharacterized protein (TIGR02284 family)
VTKFNVKTKLSLIMMIGSALWCTTSVYAEKAKEVEQVKVAQNAEDTAKTLQSLAHYEIDASFLLGQAIENVKDEALKNSLIEIRAKCEKNIKILSNLTQQYGREAPAHSKDFKGYFMQGYLAMRGLASDHGVMSALHWNLQSLARAYEEALKTILPDDAREKVTQAYKDTKDHLKYVASHL